MVEQKNEITIWTWTCPNRHTFDDGIEWGNECPVCKGRAEANTKKKQVYYRKDEIDKIKVMLYDIIFKFIPKIGVRNVRLIDKEFSRGIDNLFDCSLAPEDEKKKDKKVK